MSQAIDLCLDLPFNADDISRMLDTYYLNPTYQGYKQTYGSALVRQIGLEPDELDRIIADEGIDAFHSTVSAAANANATSIDQFIKYLDEINVKWGITVSGDHDNRKTAEIVAKYPNRFKGFIFLDQYQGMQAVRDLEMCVKEYGLHALYYTGFRTRMPANDKHNYPLFAKACELGIPLHIYSSLNLSTAVPYDIGHPRYIDEVARDFPELKIMAGVSGFPWVLEFITLAFRHKNVYLNFETHEPAKLAIPGAGYESYLYYADRKIQDRLCFASNWTTQSISVGDLIKQVEALPLSDVTKRKILYDNAERFYHELSL